MTDPIEEAERLAANLPTYAADTVRALIAAARADREARIRAEAELGERQRRWDGQYGVHVATEHTLRASLAEAEAKLAAVTAERDDWMHGRVAYDEALDRAERAEAALAEALAAMPTGDERLALASAYAATVEHATGGCEHRATPTAERELAALREWMRRLDAFRVSQQQNGFAAAFGAFPDLPPPCPTCSEAPCECEKATEPGEPWCRRCAGSGRNDIGECWACRGTGKRKGGEHG